MEQSFMREVIETADKIYERYKRPGSSRHLDLKQGFEKGAKWARDKFEIKLAFKESEIETLKAEIVTLKNQLRFYAKA